MVGFGEFLDRVGRDCGVEEASLEYRELKRTLYLVAEKAGLKISPDSYLDALPRHRRQQSSAGGSSNGSANGAGGANGAANGDGLSNSGLEDWVEERSPTSSCGRMSLRGSPPAIAKRVVVGGRALTPQLFVVLLEEEMDRVDQICRQRLRALQRVRQVLDVARRVREESQNAQEFGIVMVQLTNIYDDIVLLLWFMYLNSIAVSKIVKKYNKHFPAQVYTVDPSRWLFLRDGFQRPHAAKSAVETAFAEFVTTSPSQGPRDRAGSGNLGGGKVVAELAKGMSELMDKHKHHLYVSADDSGWVVKPSLVGTPSINHLKPNGNANARAGKGANGNGAAAAAAGAFTSMYRQNDQGYHTRLGGEYMRGAIVGRGAYGTVCKAKVLRTQQTVAIKTISDVWTHPILAQRTYRELMIMTQLSHPNVMPVLDLLLDDPTAAGSIHIVMPLITHTCEQLLTRGQLLPQHKKWFMLQLLSALAYMHALGVVHRDLKLSNVLIDDRPSLYLSDFGLARTLASGDEVAVRDCPDYVQTQWYRAPEVLLCSKLTSPATDVWSTGCIFAELLTGVPLFPGQDDRQQLELLLSCCVLPPADESPLRRECGDERLMEMAGGMVLPQRSLDDVLRVSWKSQQCTGNVQQTFSFPCALELLDELLKFEPTQRASARELMQHKFFTDIPIDASYIEEVKHAAVPLVGEEPVKLDLPCTELHTAPKYRAALNDSGAANVRELSRRKGIRLMQCESAAFIQRFWRWRRRGGPRPPKRRMASWQDIRRARPVRTVAPAKSHHSSKSDSGTAAANWRPKLPGKEANCTNLMDSFTACAVPGLCTMQ